MCKNNRESEIILLLLLRIDISDGFRKIVSPSQGSLYSAAKENFEFFHSNFQKDRFDLLDQVKRKHSRLGSGGESTTTVKSEDLERALVDIQSMKNRQKEICENLDDLGKYVN